jgi:signal transduction histidine kinase
MQIKESLSRTQFIKFDACTGAVPPSAGSVLPMGLNAIEELALKPIFKRPNQQMVRIWVPCCGDGLSTYMLAAAALNLSTREKSEHEVRIFGTDCDRLSISAARLGSFEHSGDIPSHLQAYVSADESQWWVHRGVRDMCVFAEHNLFKDPPFSHLDLIVCASPEILRPEMAASVLPLFNHSLAPHGRLVTSAPLNGEFAELFEPADGRYPVYIRRQARRRFFFQFPDRGFSTQAQGAISNAPESSATRQSQELEIQRLRTSNLRLKRANLSLHRILSSTDSCLLLFSSSLQLRMYHEPAHAPFHLNSTDIGLPLSALNLNLKLPHLPELVSRVIATGITHREEVQDVQGRWHSLRILPYIGGPAQPRGALMVVSESTELHLLRQHEECAREDAEHASRAKDEFLAIVSHELRTPLTPIVAWARMLRMPQLDHAKCRMASEAIERNVGIQKRLIEDLLDVSRIIAGKLRLDCAQHDLAAVVRVGFETIHNEVAGKQINLSLDLEEGATVWGDRDRLAQVFWNLAANAVKFTPAGGQISASLRKQDGEAIITVCDSGEGIPSDLLPKLFERFRQGDSSITRRHGGLGLGLTIAKSVVELHHGTIEAHSGGMGRGAQFVVRLPLAREAQPQEVREVAAEHA